MAVQAQQSVRHDPVRRRVAVAKVVPLAHALVRVTLEGPELEGFASDGPADHVKVFVPSVSGDEVFPRDFTPFAYHAPEPGTADPHELDIDVVLHGDDGPASAWASRAKPGEELEIGGPRGSRLVPDGVERFVFVLDETGFPAAARWLRLLPPAVPVHGVLDVEDRGSAAYFDAVAVARRPELRAVVRKLTHRPHLTEPPSIRKGHEDDLLSALREFGPFEPGDLIFLAGEAGVIQPLRRHLRREMGLPREQVLASGYWKRGVPALDHHAPLDPDDPD